MLSPVFGREVLSPKGPKPDPTRFSAVVGIVSGRPIASVNKNPRMPACDIMHSTQCAVHSTYAGVPVRQYTTTVDSDGHSAIYPAISLLHDPRIMASISCSLHAKILAEVVVSGQGNDCSFRAIQAALPNKTWPNSLRDWRESIRRKLESVPAWGYRAVEDAATRECLRREAMVSFSPGQTIAVEELELVADFLEVSCMYENLCYPVSCVYVFTCASIDQHLRRIHDFGY